MLLLEKSKISEPKSYKSKERSEWRLKIDAIIRRISVLKKKSILFFLIIPIVEIIAHLIIGEYELNRQLLTMTFYLIFQFSLVILLLGVKGKKSNRIERKYTWKTGVNL